MDTLRYLMLPVDTLCYIPVDTCRYLMLPVGTCTCTSGYLMLPVDTCRYLMLPVDTECFLWTQVDT